MEGNIKIYLVAIVVIIVLLSIVLFSLRKSPPSTNISATNSTDMNAKPATYFLDVESTVGQSSWGSVSGSGNYTNGTVVTISAIPNPGYTFAYWNCDPIINSTSCYEGTNSSANIMINGYNIIETANFATTYATATGIPFLTGFCRMNLTTINYADYMKLNCTGKDINKTIDTWLIEVLNNYNITSNQTISNESLLSYNTSIYLNPSSDEHGFDIYGVSLTNGLAFPAVVTVNCLNYNNYWNCEEYYSTECYTYTKTQVCTYYSNG